MGNNPYHDQHIAEFTACVDESMTMLQLHYDSILMRQTNLIESLMREVEELKRQVAAKPQQVEVDIVPTQSSLRKLKDSVMGFSRR